jgi:lactate dehydrogenase-like 2-hydroxyacid dehydrogenase
MSMAEYSPSSEYMSANRSVALQMSPFSAYLEAGIAQRFEVVRWFEIDAATREKLLSARAADVRAVVTAGHVGCPLQLMQLLPNLGCIAINGVGLDKVDLAVIRQRGIALGTTPGTLSEDVADLAVGLLIALLREIPAGDAHVRSGAWPRAERPLARKVTGKRFGILGLGQIGLAIAQRLAPFGPVAYSGPRRKPVSYMFHDDVISLARAVDVLVVACPANATTSRLVDAGVIDALGPSGYVVNISRGAVVDEAALVSALASGRLAGAALDVFENEPNVPESLRQLPNTVLTPHVASATQETRTHMAELVLANLDAFLLGQPLPATPF